MSEVSNERPTRVRGTFRGKGWVTTTVLIISVLVVFVVLIAAIRRAPVATMAAVAVIGLALHTGLVTLPAPIRAPVAHLGREIHSWQQRKTRALICLVAETSAARTGDEAAIDRATRLCDAG
jgi:hypothetical protein